MHHSNALLVLLFVTAALLIGAVTRQRLKDKALPYTVALLLIGLLLGLGNQNLWLAQQLPTASQTLNLVANIDPHLILFVFLPILIFESAFSMEVHLFKKMASQIATLAVPGLILSTLITAALMKWLLPWDWSWPVALMFGALISATDPVAVVALLKEVSSRKRLETLVEGESLFNDGTAIVLFGLFFSLVMGGSNLSLAAISLDFIQVVAGGLLLGAVVGYLGVRWLRQIFNDPMIEITVSLAIAFSVFFLAESWLHVSGVVAIVAMALVFASSGRTGISPEVEHLLHHFWQMLAHIANTIIFLLVGIIIGSQVEWQSLQLWWYLLLLYPAIMLVRALVVLLFMPLLKKLGIGITRQKATVLVWGGLRGAVSLALALSLAQNTELDGELKQQILFLTAGIVVLTTVINGSSMGWLLAKLGLAGLPPAKQAMVDKAEQQIQQQLQLARQQLQQDNTLDNIDWPDGSDNIAALNQGKTPDNKQENSPENKPLAPSNDASWEDTNIAFKRRLLETERQHYWTLFKQNSIGPEATTKLVEAVEFALDREPIIAPRHKIEDYWLSRYQQSHEANTLWLERLKKLITDCSDHMKEQRLLRHYDSLRGFILAQQHTQTFIERLSPNAKDGQQACAQYQRNTDWATQLLSQLQAEQPDLAQTYSRYTGSRLLLSKRRDLIEQLHHSAVLDSPEANKLTEAVERELAKLSR